MRESERGVGSIAARKEAIETQEFVGEFSGSGLQILATAPSPIKLQLIVTICVALLLAIVVASVFHVDVIAIAQGKVQPIGRSKVVQSSEAGRVSSISVRDGAVVTEGELLVELDHTEASAEHDATSLQYFRKAAEAIRHAAAAESVRSGSAPEMIPALNFSQEIPEQFKIREQGALDADMLRLLATMRVQSMRIAEEKARHAGAKVAFEEGRKLLEIVIQGLQIKENLQAAGLEPIAQTLVARESHAREQDRQASRGLEVVRLEASIATLQEQLRETRARFIADSLEARNAAMAARDELEEQRVKTLVRIERTKIVAPTSGVVQELAVRGVGQVVGAKEQLLVIVPTQAPLEVEVLVENRDIGFVRVGQEAIIKLDAFPFARYGAVDGIVERISSESVDPQHAFGGDGAVQPSAQQVPGYPVTVRIASGVVSADGQVVPLAAGMTCIVEIVTGRRTIIGYLLSPVLKTFSEAGRER